MLLPLADPVGGCSFLGAGSVETALAAGEGAAGVGVREGVSLISGEAGGMAAVLVGVPGACARDAITEGSGATGFCGAVDLGSDAGGEASGVVPAVVFVSAV